MKETQKLDPMQLASLMGDYDSLANKFADLLSLPELPQEVRQSVEGHIKEMMSRLSLSDPNTVRVLYPVLRRLTEENLLKPM